MDGAQGVKFVLMVNKQGHTRFSKWMQHVEDDPHRRRMMEYELVRKCMPRDVDHVRCGTCSHSLLQPSCLAELHNACVDCNVIVSQELLECMRAGNAGTLPCAWSAAN